MTAETTKSVELGEPPVKKLVEVKLGEPPVAKVEEKGLWDYIVDFFTPDETTNKKEENKGFEKVDITEIKSQEIKAEIMREHPYQAIPHEWEQALQTMENAGKIGYSMNYDNFGAKGRNTVSIDDVIEGKADRYQTNCSDSVADLVDYMIRKNMVDFTDEQKREFKQIHTNVSAAKMTKFFLDNAEQHNGLTLSGDAARDPSNYKPGMMIYFDNNYGNRKDIGTGEMVGHTAVVQEVSVGGEKKLVVMNFTGSSNESKNQIGDKDAFAFMELDEFFKSRAEYNIKAVEMFPQTYNNYINQVEQTALAKMEGNDELYNAMANNLDNYQMIASNNVIKYSAQNENELMASKIQSIQGANEQQMYASNDVQVQANASFKI